MLKKSLKALHNHWCKCYRSKVRSFETDLLGMRMIVADFKQGGMMVCDREVLKIFMKTPVSWSAQA